MGWVSFTKTLYTTQRRITIAQAKRAYTAFESYPEAKLIRGFRTGQAIQPVLDLPLLI